MTIKWFGYLLALATIVLVAGCKTELYTGLSEQEANEMFALLSESGINVDKRMGKDKKETTVDILVESDQIPIAMSILSSRGYPKEQYASMGEVFVKQGMISSPMEEKARYNFAVSQELRETLSRIDGVLDARVHVVLPTEARGGNEASPSSASVFIKHIDTMSVENLIPKVKSLVANSVEGLNYSAVSVVLFPSVPTQIRVAAVEASNGGLFDLANGSWLVTGAVTLLVLFVIVIIGLIYVLGRQKKQQVGKNVALGGT